MDWRGRESREDLQGRPIFGGPTEEGARKKAEEGPEN